MSSSVPSKTLSNLEIDVVRLFVHRSCVASVAAPQASVLRGRRVFTRQSRQISRKRRFGRCLSSLSSSSSLSEKKFSLMHTVPPKDRDIGRKKLGQESDFFVNSKAILKDRVSLEFDCRSCSNCTQCTFRVAF